MNRHLTNLCQSPYGVGVGEVVNVPQSIDVARPFGDIPAEFGLVEAEEAGVESILSQGVTCGAVLQDSVDHGILLAISGLAYPFLSLK